MSVTDGGLDGAFGAPIIPIAWSLKGGKAIAWGISKLQWRAERPVGGVCRGTPEIVSICFPYLFRITSSPMTCSHSIMLSNNCDKKNPFSNTSENLPTIQPILYLAHHHLNTGESSGWTILWSDAARVQVSENFRRIWIAAVFQFHCHSLSVDEKNFCLSRWCPTTKILSPSNGRGGLTMPQNQSPLKWQNTTYTI